MSKIFLSVVILFSGIVLCDAREVSHKIQFEIQKVTSNVYTAHPHGPISRINVTSTIIVSSSFLTVIDAQPDIVFGRELIRTIRAKISKLPVRYLIFTHYHIDHILGAGAFLEHYPEIILVGHQKINEYVAGPGAKEKENWKDYLIELSARQSTNENSNNEIPELKKYAADVDRSKLIGPNIFFSDSLSIVDQDLNIELKSYPGHTMSDIVIYHKTSGAMMTGDLIHDFEPLFIFDHANPELWIASLSEISKREFKYIIGGHGDFQAGKETLTQWLNYLTELKEKTTIAIASGQDLDDLKKSATEESFKSLIQNSYGKRIQNRRSSLMSEVFIGPLDDAIAGEINYLWTFYSGKK